MTGAFPVFGDGHFNVESPAAQGTVTDRQGNTARIVWKGLTGHLSEHDDRATLEFRAPSLTVESGDTRLVVGNMHVASSGRSLTDAGVRDNPNDWRSKATLSVDQFRIETTRVTASCR